MAGLYYCSPHNGRSASIRWQDTTNVTARHVFVAVLRDRWIPDPLPSRWRDGMRTDRETVLVIRRPERS